MCVTVPVMFRNATECWTQERTRSCVAAVGKESVPHRQPSHFCIRVVGDLSKVCKWMIWRKCCRIDVYDKNVRNQVYCSTKVGGIMTDVKSCAVGTGSDEGCVQARYLRGTHNWGFFLQ